VVGGDGEQANEIPVTMCDCPSCLVYKAVDRENLYLTNPHGQKLLKLSLKNELATNGNTRHAKIEVILLLSPFQFIPKRVESWP
jgi:hypothetical protein